MLDVREVFHCSVKDLSDDELNAAIRDFAGDTSTRFWVSYTGGQHRIHRLEPMLMDIFDSFERGNWLFLAANSKQKPKKPIEYPRWWKKQAEEKVGKRKVRMMTRKDAAAYYKNLVKKRDPSITNEEIQKRNKAYNDRLESRKEK